MTKTRAVVWQSDRPVTSQLLRGAPCVRMEAPEGLLWEDPTEIASRKRGRLKPGKEQRK